MGKDGKDLKGFAPAIASVVKDKMISSSAGTTTASKKPDAPREAMAEGSGSGATAKATVPTKPSTTTSKRGKKRGPKKAATADVTEEETVIKPLPSVDGSADFAPISLSQVRLRLAALLGKLPKDLPSVPPAYNPALEQSHADVVKFASDLQVIVEEWNLLISLVSASTYEWGVDRSGASQQNLSVMSSELQQCQDTVSNIVSPRLSNVLCPQVDLMLAQTEIIRDGSGGEADEGDGDVLMNEPRLKKRKLDGGNEDKLAPKYASREVRRNTYERLVVDRQYVHLCHQVLARNAELTRFTFATSIKTASKVIGDYLAAMKKDDSHGSKGGWA